MNCWTSSPTRRELTLLLFCVTVFIVAYNSSTSLRLVGFNSSSLTSRPIPIGPDGRRPEGYRDGLENEIFGEWDWEPGHIAAVKEAESARVMHGKTYGNPDAYLRGEGQSGEQAMWLQGVGEGRYGQGEGLGSTSVNDDLVRWGEDVPTTQLLRHVPGFTILDNVILFSGTFFVITNDTTSMPDVGAIGSSMVFPAQSAHSKFGPYAGRCALIATSAEDASELTSVFLCRHYSMHGVTFVSYDGPSTTDSHTLISLQRLYSTLNTSPAQPLSPPHRLFFPAVSTFTDHPEPVDENIPRSRSNIGVAPETLKAAYPSLAGPLYAGDFDDFVGIGAPLLLDRLVVADRGAARRAGVPHDVPAWAPMFAALEAAEDWFDPVRHTLARYFGAPEEDTAAGTRTVTYLARQDGLEGERLRAADHAALLDALAGLARTGVTVHVVDEKASWTERMRAVAQSTIVLSVFGEHIADAVFMKRRPQSALMEFFPPNVFNRDWETVVQSMGIRYVAWQGNQKYSGENLPTITRAPTYEDFALDAQAVVRAISEEFDRGA
ncbi:hypothetical protein EDB92DRAFT_2115927 [Lactarius akahatsu]|uniref:Uncharacterized protein n=1 Tax=Lactarius akahatsu TaxID=416441 RepID=A0AAD4Q6A9_9AGAM|nr:hypothetical protein EDB92DRAFT_2115927 [Lactarius akahatsu]